MKRSAEHYLAFDLGAGSGRAVLGRLDGARLQIHELCRFANAPAALDGSLYWDVLALWGHVVDALRRCARTGHRRLSGIGVDTWGVDFGLLGGDGRLFGHPICYRDPMTEGVDAYMTSVVPPREWFRTTGMAPGRVTTFAQLIAARRGAGRTRLSSAQTLLMMPDLLRYYLCGHVGSERTILGSSLLLDIHRKTWASRLLRRFDIPRRLFPPLVDPAAVAGLLNGDIAAETGLARAPVMIVAGHDTASAAAAAPFADEDTAFISSGTWLVAGAIQDRPVTSDAALAAGFVNEIGLDSILLVKNLMGLYLFENLRRALAARGTAITYARMIAEAERAAPFSGFLDLDCPLFFVAHDPEAQIRAFLRRTGQRVSLNRGTLIRLVLEGVAWKTRLAFQSLPRITGRTYRRISMVGGGTRNALHCRMLADATGLPVIAGPAEATVAGNLGAQILASGRLKTPADIRTLVQRSFAVRTYRPRLASAWDRHEECYRSVMKASKRIN